MASTTSLKLRLAASLLLTVVLAVTANGELSLLATATATDKIGA